ncbi:MAG: hypothetical protein D4S01_11270 [Dehalococcoidia bacterium]|nr:MAG: hypothetical protein D4S01_11270 [Dehalococcoidia bacterium]
MSNTIILKDILAKKTIAKLNKEIVIAQVANTEYEGELRTQGDTVSVQTFPNVDLTYGGTAGDDITAVDWAITAEDLEVTEVFQTNQAIKDLEAIQSNLSLQSEIAASIAYAMKLTYDRYVARLAVEGANTSNRIVPGAAVTLNNTAADADNIMTRLSQLAVKLKNSNAFRMPYLFINPAVEALALNSNLVTGFDKGLGYRENGAIGKIFGMMAYTTTDLPVRYLVTMTGVAVADETIVFTVTDNKGTAHTVTFTAKAAPSAAGEFDIAASAAAQVDIMVAMINGTGTPSATNYIALSAADRNYLRSVGASAVEASTTSFYVTLASSATLDTLSAGITNGTVSAKGVVLFACDDKSVHFVKQEDGMKVTDAPSGFRSNLLVENVYGGKVFTENAKRIATIDVTNS